MEYNDLTGFDIIVYHEQYPFVACKPHYIGFMGVFLKGIKLDYPVGTPVEIEFLVSKNKYIDGMRVPMIINSSKADGTGLRLNDFDRYMTNKWQSILQAMKKTVVSNQLDDVIEQM